MTMLRFATAREVFEAIPAMSEDMRSGPSDDSPVAHIRALASGDTPEDAIAFLAYVLGRREAVWWSCQCVRALGDIAPGQEDEALRMAEAWVRDPVEDRRRAALAHGMAANKEIPTSWLPLAVGWSGGSIVEGQQPVPTQPYLTPRAVRGAILVALARRPAARRAEGLNVCVQAGLRMIEARPG